MDQIFAIEIMVEEYLGKVKCKVGAHTVAAGSHLPLHRSLSLWWKLIHYPETQSHCDIRVSIAYLP